MERNHRYILKPYRTKADRTTCPACGHNGEFSPYIDTETGEILDESVGRCNREKNCGYHYTPAEFFRDYPDRKDETRDHLPIRQTAITSIVNTAFQTLPAKFIPTMMAIESCNLYRFFSDKFGADKARTVFELYHVGASKHWTNDGGLSVSFPQIDEHGRLRQVKVMAYNPTTGKRLHKEHPAQRLAKSGYFTDVGTADKVWFAGKFIIGNADVKLRQCFFGQHLLPKFKEVSIVESEKTAMIASLFFPDACWLATGGKNGCRWTSKEVAACLVGKKVILYPDLGCVDAWTKNAGTIRAYGVDVSVSKLLETLASSDEKEKGLDLGDFLLRQELPQEEEVGQPAQQDEKPFTIGDVIRWCNDNDVKFKCNPDFSIIINSN